MAKIATLHSEFSPFVEAIQAEYDAADNKKQAHLALNRVLCEMWASQCLPTLTEMKVLLGAITKPEYDAHGSIVGRVQRWKDSSIKTVATCVMAWLKTKVVDEHGQPVFPGSVAELVSKRPEDHVKGKGGRTAGQGAGKSTKAKAKAEAEDAPKSATTLKDLLDSLRGMYAGLPKITASMEVANAWQELMATIRNEIQAQNLKDKAPTKD